MKYGLLYLFFERNIYLLLRLLIEGFLFLTTVIPAYLKVRRHFKEDLKLYAG